MSPQRPPNEPAKVRRLLYPTLGGAPDLVLADVGLRQLPEFMHYLYLPVMMPFGDTSRVGLPENLQCLEPMVETARKASSFTEGADFMYVTAKRAYIPQGHHPNRPGWHVDGFGTDDVSFVWCNDVPPVWADQPFDEVSRDHVASIVEMTTQIDERSIRSLSPGALWALDTSVVHATSPARWGADRSFVKITVSRDKFNLDGNSHNPLFNYAWKMRTRGSGRNHTTKLDQ